MRATSLGTVVTPGGVFQPVETPSSLEFPPLTTTTDLPESNPTSTASSLGLDTELVASKYPHGDALRHLPHAIDDEGDFSDDLQVVKMERRSSKRANSSNLSDSTKIRSKLSLEFSKLKSQLRSSNNDNNNNVTRIKFDTLDISKLPHLNSFQQIKIITNDDFIDLFLSYLSTDLPSVDTMFPWLHGLHPNNYGQLNFFMSKQDNSKPKVIQFTKPDVHRLGGYGDDDNSLFDDLSIFETPANVKFLMPIRSSNSIGENSLDFTNVIIESSGLIKGSVTPHDILIPITQISNLSNYLINSLPNFIFDLIPYDVIIEDCKITKLIPEFHNLDPKTGINLRNFHIQVSKLSHVSDFLVYCFNDDHSHSINNHSSIPGNCKCSSLSRLLHLAQLIYQFNHPELEIQQNSKRYNTLIVTDLNEGKLVSNNVMGIENINLDSANKNDNELCSNYDIHVFHNWDSNYLYRERLEISKMSSATPMNNNVWLGNITDFECLQIKLNTNQSINQLSSEKINELIKSFKKIPNYTNFNKSSIVKLTKNQFENKTHSQIDELLINSPLTNWKILIFCNEKSKIPTLTELEPIFENLHDLELINLNFPVSGSLSLVDLSIDNILSILNICKLIYYKCQTDFPCLIYCSDGYTESSLFALFFMIYSFGISVDEAILKLHTEYGRPFFIFKSDYGLLIKLEQILIKYSPVNNQDDQQGDELKFENDKSSIRTLLLKPNRSRSNSTVMSNNTLTHNGSMGLNSFITNTGHHIVQFRGFQNSSIGSGSPGSFGSTQFGFSHRTTELPIIPDTPMIPLDKIEISGSLSGIDGSLPSLILPHLYLGSIDHASSIPLLTRLGIGYIVSVGERVSWVNDLKYDRFETDSGCEIINIHPNQKLFGSPYEVKVKSVIRFQNLNDDGIGTLTDTIDDALKFIDECYEDNGKVLVHCQVGVSRSATVCIAEVIKRLNVSLPRAYMYVRVRRLNVIIQPNLKLMYELFKWEEKYHKKKISNGGKQLTSNITTIREVDWYILCREIYNLNKNYIR